jgi:RimJ/RimL family protein N-acetyltransferase
MCSDVGMRLDAGAWTLRPIDADDRAGIVRAGQEPSIAGQIPWFPQPFPDHYADGWIERAIASWRDGSHRVFSILERDGGYAGSVALSRLESGDGLEVSYWILPEQRQRGAATSAVKAACDWASANLAPAKIRAKTLASNTASQRVLLASGFAQDGGDDRFRFFVRL